MKTRSKVLATSVEVGSEVEHYYSNERADFEDEPTLVPQSRDELWFQSWSNSYSTLTPHIRRHSRPLLSFFVSSTQSYSH